MDMWDWNIFFSPDIEDPNDRVEVAFRRLDSDGDGYLHLEDFVHVSNKINFNLSLTPRFLLNIQIGWPIVENNVDQNQLQRIFHHCDQTGDGRVSLQVGDHFDHIIDKFDIKLKFRSLGNWLRVMVISQWRGCLIDFT